MALSTTPNSFVIDRAQNSVNEYRFWAHNPKRAYYSHHKQTRRSKQLCSGTSGGAVITSESPCAVPSQHPPSLQAWMQPQNDNNPSKERVTSTPLTISSRGHCWRSIYVRGSASLAADNECLFSEKVAHLRCTTPRLFVYLAEGRNSTACGRSHIWFVGKPITEELFRAFIILLLRFIYPWGLKMQPQSDVLVLRLSPHSHFAFQGLWSLTFRKYNFK